MGGFDFDCDDFDEEKMTCTNPDCENYDEEHEGNCNLMWTKEDGKALYDNYARRKPSQVVEKIQSAFETCANCGAENYNEMDADVCLTCCKCGSSIDVTYKEVKPPNTNTKEKEASQEGE